MVDVDVQDYLDRIKDVIVVMSETTADVVREMPGVQEVEEDNMDLKVLGRRVPDQPEAGAGRKLSEEKPYGIAMVKADDGVFANPTDRKKVCVVDTGYDLGHEDLPDADGFSPYGVNEKWDVDGHGHGTHCAGTIGAIGDNGKGVVGVQRDPGDDFFFIGKGLTNAGSGSSSSVMKAVEECVNAGANIISMSLGGGSFSSTFDQQYTQHYEEDNVLIIAAAGNGGNSALSYPASYKSVMSVAAVDSNKNRAGFSQYNDQVEIAAPGVAVKSTTPGDNYSTFSGTSMACPHVAGVAAIVWGKHPDCSAHEIRHALVITAEDRGDAGCDNKYGYGIVDAKAAHEYLSDNGCSGGLPPATEGGCEFYTGPTAAPEPTAAPTIHECSGSQTSGKFTIKIDKYGKETAWTIKNGNGSEVASGKDYDGGSTNIEDICFESGEHTFTIEDDFNDGICCSWGQGFYKLDVNGVEVIGGGEFGKTETKTFTIEGSVGTCKTWCETIDIPFNGNGLKKCDFEDLCDGCSACN